jgi:colanic acid biosynthesis glycosyl transferase WcaI
VQDLEVDAAFAVGHLSSFRMLKTFGFAFERMTLKRFDKVITISNRMAEKLAEKGVAKDRLALVRNWVDLAHIYPMDGPSPYRAELGFTADDFVVLYSGNIGAKQGLNVLLDAAERLRHVKNIHFIVAGEGPLKATLQETYGHLANLRFLPFQPYARLNEFLNMADLHALPQDKGAADLVLPSKLGGMLASGKPVLVTAEDGTELAEFVRGAAIIVPPGDAEQLAAGIVHSKATVNQQERDHHAAERSAVLSSEQGLKFLASLALTVARDGLDKLPKRSGQSMSADTANSEMSG